MLYNYNNNNIYCYYTRRLYTYTLYMNPPTIVTYCMVKTPEPYCYSVHDMTIDEFAFTFHPYYISILVSISMYISVLLHIFFTCVTGSDTYLLDWLSQLNQMLTYLKSFFIVPSTSTYVAVKDGLEVYYTKSRYLTHNTTPLNVEMVDKAKAEMLEWIEFKSKETPCLNDIYDFIVHVDNSRGVARLYYNEDFNIFTPTNVSEYSVDDTPVVADLMVYIPVLDDTNLSVIKKRFELDMRFPICLNVTYNHIFTFEFLKWHLYNFHNFELKPEHSYVITIMINNVSFSYDSGSGCQDDRFSVLYGDYNIFLQKMKNNRIEFDNMISEQMIHDDDEAEDDDTEDDDTEDDDTEDEKQEPDITDTTDSSKNTDTQEKDEFFNVSTEDAKQDQDTAKPTTSSTTTTTVPTTSVGCVIM